MKKAIALLEALAGTDKPGLSNFTALAIDAKQALQEMSQFMTIAVVTQKDSFDFIGTITVDPDEIVEVFEIEGVAPGERDAVENNLVKRYSHANWLGLDD